MSGSIPVFVNQRALLVEPDATVADAVAAFDPALGTGLAGGAVTVTDARGLPVDPGSPVFAGAILRAIVSARGRGEEDDAHP